MSKGVLLLYVSILTWTAPGGAYTFFIGYSGAPGTYGLCGRSCHGAPGGTITVTGFPARYQPGRTYTIKVSGDSIRQFNGSCRVGRDSLNAGTITAGYNTETYCDPVETNGVHLLEPSSDSGLFYWTAPARGTDTVRLYIAGEQGIMSWGPNTEWVLVSAEMTGVEERPQEAPCLKLKAIEVVPNPFRFVASVPGRTSESFSLYDISGRKVGVYQGDRIGLGLSAGIYFLKPHGNDTKLFRMVKVR